MPDHATSRPGLGALLALTLLLPSTLAPPGVRADGDPPEASPQERPIWDPELLRRAGLDPALLTCNASVIWGSDLRQQSRELADQVAAALPPGHRLNPEDHRRFADAVSEIGFWRLVRVLMIDGQNHNAGVIGLRGFHWTDATGRQRPVLVFRSAITSLDGADPSCSAALLRHGEVRHVVNLYDADKIPVGPLIQQEEALARSCGASYLTPVQAVGRYGPWREELRSLPPGSAGHRRAVGQLARLIREQILAPGGRPPAGNIYVHCGGGMHRSGMVMGILDRCVNGASMPVVTRRYLWHTAWRSPEEPGGAEPGNLEVIARFDCRSLGPLPTGA